MSSSRAQAMRRYPALSYLAGAAGLALLLPSGLTLPQSGPSTLAEFAPVPGQGQGSGDVSELGQAGANGLGSGGGLGGGRGGPDGGDGGVEEDAPGDSGRLIRRPGTKNCVGNPPRQTEDPLSPPCAAFFDGDNGGRTAKGVTGDAVTVLVQFNNSGGDQRAGAVVDCSETTTEEDTLEDYLCKSYQRYFNNRYQTYKRVVRMYAVHQNAGDLERFNPFAYVTVTGPSGSWAQRNSLSVGYSGTQRSSYQRYAPRIISFRADEEDQIAQTGSYICLKLAGRTARHAGDPTLQDDQRKFGFLFFDIPRKDKIRADVRARCGVDIVDETDDYETPLGVSRLRSAGVTTVIVVTGNTAHATATNYATQIGYFPEWFVPGSGGLNGVDVNFHSRTANQAQWANAFGLTYDLRRAAMAEQPWYRAYREGCPTACPEPRVGEQGYLFAAASYEALTMLFYGIQAAGPRLTHENLDRGMHAIEPRGSTDPFRPAAYFAPGNYSFIKDAMAIYWDPTGTPPGSPNTGCWRLPYEGRRFRAGEWTEGDADVKRQGPCQADTFQ